MPYETTVSAALRGDTDAEISAFDAMHDRLVTWGLCWLRGGGRDVDTTRVDIVRVNNKIKDEAIWRETTTPYREADPVFDRRDWTQPEIDAAGRLHNRVIALPIQRSLVLQVFYFEEDAKEWHKMPPAKQELRIRDLTLWRGKPLGVNARIERHNRDKYDCVPLIVPEAFMSIRHRAVRELTAREAGLSDRRI